MTETIISKKHKQCRRSINNNWLIVSPWIILKQSFSLQTHCTTDNPASTDVVSGLLLCDQLAVGSIGLWTEQTVASSHLAASLPHRSEAEPVTFHRAHLSLLVLWKRGGIVKYPEASDACFILYFPHKQPSVPENVWNELLGIIYMCSLTEG